MYGCTRDDYLNIIEASEWFFMLGGLAGSGGTDLSALAKVRCFTFDHLKNRADR